MINEIDGFFDGDDEELPQHYVGEMWAEFKAHIPDDQYKILSRGLTYILLTYPDSALPMQITETFVNDQLDTNAKKQVIWGYIVDNIIEIMTKMGLVLNLEYVDNKFLPQYIRLVDTLYTLPGYEDTMGLTNILDSLDIDPVERLEMVLRKLLGIQADLEHYAYIIRDVSEVLLKSFSDGMKGNNEIENPPKNIINRVIGNKPLFTNTLMWTHIVNQGQLGGAVDSLMNFFKHDLARVLEDEGQERYGINLVCLVLISEINNSAVKETVSRLLDNEVEDITVRMKLDSCIAKLNLEEPVSEEA